MGREGRNWWTEVFESGHLEDIEVNIKIYVRETMFENLNRLQNCTLLRDSALVRLNIYVVLLAQDTCHLSSPF